MSQAYSAFPRIGERRTTIPTPLPNCVSSQTTFHCLFQTANYQPSMSDSSFSTWACGTRHRELYSDLQIASSAKEETGPNFRFYDDIAGLFPCPW